MSRHAKHRIPSLLRRRPIVATILFALHALACFSDGSSPFAAEPDGPALRIGLTPNYPPVVFRDGDELRGIEPELARIAARELGRSPEFVPLEWDALIPALEAGEIDVIMSGVSITEQRAERVLFTEPYMRVGQLAMIRSADLARLGSPDKLRQPEVRVGYVRDTTGAAYVATSLSRAESFAFDSADDGVRALRSERVDFFIHDAPTIWRYTLDPGNRDLMGLYRALTDEHLAWAVRKEDAELKAELDGALSRLRDEGRLEPILRKWVPIRVVVRD